MSVKRPDGRSHKANHKATRGGKRLESAEVAFRKKHQPERPPYLGVMLREGDCRCLADGLVTDSVRQMAREALTEFWPIAAAEDTLATK